MLLEAPRMELAERPRVATPGLVQRQTAARSRLAARLLTRAVLTARAVRAAILQTAAWTQRAVHQEAKRILRVVALPAAPP